MSKQIIIVVKTDKGDKKLVPYDYSKKLIITTDYFADINKIYSISNISFLKCLTDLNIFGNGTLKYIPDEIYNIKTLKCLIIQNTKINKISPKIGQLTNLKELTIHYNKIKRLPAELYNLKKLELLKISNNPINRISNKISNLNYLNKFYSDLEILPKSFYKLDKITTLSINRNYYMNNVEANIIYYYNIHVKKLILSNANFKLFAHHSNLYKLIFLKILFYKNYICKKII